MNNICHIFSQHTNYPETISSGMGHCWMHCLANQSKGNLSQWMGTKKNPVGQRKFFVLASGYRVFSYFNSILLWIILCLEEHVIINANNDHSD